MAGMARFIVPAVPGDWRGHEAFRIVDPLGLSAAWVAPGNGGVPVSCHFRRNVGEEWLTGWENLAPPSGEAADPHGCHLLLQGYGDGHEPGSLAEEIIWRFHSRDPTSVTVTGDLGEQMVTITSACEDGGLRLQLVPASGSGSRRLIRAGFQLGLEGVDLDRSDLGSTGATVALDTGPTLHCRPGDSLVCEPRRFPQRRSLQLRFVMPPAHDERSSFEEPLELSIFPAWTSARPRAW